MKMRSNMVSAFAKKNLPFRFHKHLSFLFTGIITFFLLPALFTQIGFSQVRITGPTELTACSQAIFTIEIKNEGQVSACNVIVSAEIPPGFDYIEDDQGASLADDTLIWTIGQLEAGDRWVDYLTLRATPETAKPSAKENRLAITVTYDYCPAEGINDFSEGPVYSSPVKVSSPEFARRLAGHKVGQHKVPPTVEVEMTVTADIPSPIENAKLIDYFPADWTILNSGGGQVDPVNHTITWDLGILSDSVSQSYTILSPQKTLPPTKYLFHSELVSGDCTTASADWTVVVADPTDWPDSWITIDQDLNENGTEDDLRDVKTAFYNYDENYLYLRLCLYGTPDFAGPSRYKWFFDLGVGDNLYISGNNILGTEYLLFVEDTNNDGTGEVYLLDAHGYDRFREYEPNIYKTNPGPITDPTIAGYRFDGNCVDLYIKLSELKVDGVGRSNPSGINLTWATDQENPNLEQAPITDRANTSDVPIHIAPVIDVTKTDSPDPVETGQNITYTVTITNSGNIDVLDDPNSNEFEDSIPENTTYATGSIIVNGTPNDDDISDGIGYDSVNNKIIWNGIVPAGGSVTISFQVTVKSPLPNGTQISNQGFVWWDSDGDGVNDAYEPTDDPLTTEDNDPTITTVHSAPLLMITKDDWPDPVKPGETLTYTIIYQNIGNGVAHNVVITETYDANVTFSSASPSPDSGTNNRWTIASLSPADGQQTVTINVTVNANEGTTLHNYVNITCDEGIFEDDTEETKVSSAILILSKADNPDPVPAGELLSYTLTYQNMATDNVTETVITDTLPYEVSYVSASPAPNSTSDGTLTWNIGKLAPGASGNITITVRVNTPIDSGTVITDNVTITGYLGGAEKVGTDVEETTIISAPIIAVEKTDSPDPVEAGGTLTYNITVTNSGNADATGVSVVDDYNETILTITDAGGGVDNGDTITWDGGITIPAAGSVSYAVTAKVASPLDNGIKLFNTVSVDCDQGVTASTTEITTVHSAPLLMITKDDRPDPVKPGETLTYTLTYQNTGNEVAHDVVIADYLPADVTYISASGTLSFSDRTLTWDIGDLSPQVGEQTLTINVTVNSPLPDGTTLENTANIWCSQDVGSYITESTTVHSAPLLMITKDDRPDPVKPGETLTYTLIYENTGNAVAHNVVITETYDPNVTFSSASPLPDSGTNNTWTIPSLSPTDGQQTITIEVSVISPLADGTILNNYVTISCAEGVSDDDSEGTIINSEAILILSKADYPDPVPAGNLLTYTLTYQNTGTATTTGTVITDTLPNEVTYVSATPAPSSISGKVLTWEIGDLAPDGSHTITIETRVNSPLPDGTKIRNRASITSSLGVGADVEDTTVVSAPILSIEKTDSQDPVEGSGTLTYTITIANSGNADATNVVVTETYDVNFAFSSATPAPDAGTNNQWTFAIIAAGASKTITITGTALLKGEASLINTVSFTSDNAGGGSVTETTGVISANLEVTKTDTPDPVIAGNILSYSITVTNLGPSDAQNVVVSESYDTNFIFSSATPAPDTGTENQWTLATIASGATETITITGTVSASASGSLSNTVALTSDTADPNTDNNTVTEPTVVNTSADLLMEKSGPATGTAGTNITYTLTVTNLGPSDAVDVSVTDSIPTGTEWVSDTSLGAYDPATGVWTIGNLTAGSTTSLDITVKILSGTTDSLVNAAVVSTTTSDPDTTNDTASVTTTVNTSADLSITKIDSPDPVIAGTELTYTITVTNLGPSDAQDVVVTDPLPEELNNAQYSTDNGLTWSPYTGSVSLGTLTSGGEVSFLIKANVDPAVAQDTVLSNTTTVSSVTPDSDSTNNSATEPTTVNTSADLIMAKTGPTSGTAGETITYALTVTNNGPSDALEVAVTDAIPTGTEWVSDTSGGAYTPATGIWTIGKLAAGSSVSLDITVKILSGTTDSLVNTAVVSTTTFDPDTTNNEAAVSTTVNTSADLVISKSDSPDPVVAGETLTYTLKVTNNGPSDAQNVVVTDTLPAGLSNAQYSLDNGANWNPYPGSVSLDTTPYPGSTGFLIKADVDNNIAPGTVLSNTATVNSDTYDSNPNNNKGTQDTTVITPILTITKDDYPEPVKPGETLTYTLIYENTGNAVAHNVVITETYDPNVTFSSASPLPDSGTNNTWTIPSLSPTDGQQTITIEVSVISPLADGTILNNYVTISCAEGVSDDDSEGTIINSEAILILSKADYPDPVPAGNLLTYTLTYQNTGTATTTGTVITDTLPNEVTYVSATPAPSSISGKVLTWEIGDLAPDGSHTITIETRVNSPLPDGTKIRNRASITSSLGVGADVEDTTVVSAPILSIEKTDSQDPVEGSGTLTYTITIANSGNADATNVVVTETYDVNFAFSSATPAPDAGTNNQWTFAIIAAGASKTITITGTALLKGEASLINTVSFTSDNAGGGSVTETTGVISANLEVTKTDTPDPVIAGNILSYSITVTNLGPSDAQNVVVSESYDTNFIFSSATPAPDTGTENQWTLATIASGATETITITGTVSASASGSLSNTVALTSDTADPNTTNNTVTEPTAVNTSADLLMEKSGPATGTAGTNITYTLTLTNLGPSDAVDVNVTDSIPIGTEWVSDTSLGAYDPATGIWTIGNLTAGSTTSLDITVKILSGTTDSLVNTATVSSITDDPDTINDTASVTTTVNTSADVLITKSDSPDPVIAGETLTYTLTIANNGGPSSALNISITDTLPAGVTYVSDTSGVTPTVSGSDYTWNFTGTNSGPAGLTDEDKDSFADDLTPNASFSLTITVKVDANYTGTSLSNTATVSSDTYDPNPANNSATETTYVLLKPSLSIEKHVIPSSGYPGDTFTFTLVVKNTGEILVDPVPVSDTVPVALSQPFEATPSASSVVGQNIKWDNVGPLGPGDSVTLTYKTQAQPGYTGVYYNTARVMGTTPEGEIITHEARVPVTILKCSPALITKKEIVKISPEIIRFSFTVQNVSNCTAYNIDISDTLPSGFKYLSASTYLSWPGGIYTEDPQISQGGKRLFWESSITLAGGEPVGESLNLSFDIVVTDEAKPGVTYTNAAWATGENQWGDPIEPTTDEPDDTDPDDYDEVEFTIVLPRLPKLELEKTQAIIPPLPCEVARAELEKVWFQTDISMYASTELLFTGKDFLRWAERKDLTIDPLSLRPTGISLLSAQSHKYSANNIRSLVFDSGMGLNLRYGPRIEQMASKENVSNETALQRLLEKYAQAVGLEKLPENPWLIFAPYEGGDPRYIQEMKPEDWSTRRWQDYDLDIVPSALGQSLVREVLLARELLASNHTQEGKEDIQGQYLGKDALSGYLGLVVMEETANKLLLLEKLLALTREKGYFPHRIKVKFDLKDKPIDYTITDSSSHLFDQISLLWGLLEFKLLSDPNIKDNYDRLFGKGKMFSLALYELSSKLAEKVLENIYQMHYNKDIGSLIEVVQPSSQISQSQSISTTQAGLSLLVLERAYHGLYDDPVLQKRIKELALRQSGFLLNHLRAPEGGFYDGYNLKNNKVIYGKKRSLVSQVAAIRGLLATYKLTSDEKLIEVARKVFDYLEKRFWNEDFRIYTSATNSTIGYRYTPLNVGLTIGALRELIYLSDKAQAIHIFSRLTDFFHNILEEAGLELSWANLEGKLPIVQDSGRNQIREVGVIEASFGVAPVLQSEIYLILPPRVSLINLYERGPCEESQAILEEPWFVTDVAMYAAIELGKYPEEGIGKKMREYSDLNLTTLTLSSGMGLPLKYGPLLLNKAEMKGVSAEEQLEKDLQEYARLSNLKDRPNDLSYIFAEYASGDPHIKEPKALRWNPDTLDKTLRMSALGMTLVKQVLSVRNLLLTNHTLDNQEDPAGPYLGRSNLKGYLGLVLTAEMVNKLKFLEKLFTLSPQGEYLPHLVKVTFDDEGRPLDYQIIDASSDLFDQLSLLWGSSELRRFADPKIEDNYNKLFGEGKLFPSESYELSTSLARLVFENLLKMHYDKDLGTLVDRAVEGEKMRRISTINAGLAILALRSFYDSFADEPELQKEAKNLITSQTKFIIEKLKDKRGGFYSSYEESGLQSEPLVGDKTLASQSAAIRGLLTAYRLTKDKKYLEQAEKAFDYLQANFWDKNLEVYKNKPEEIAEELGYSYSPLDAGLTTGALEDLASLSSPIKADLIRLYLTKFLQKVVDKAGLQLPGRRTIRLLTPYPRIEEEYFAPVMASRISLTSLIRKIRKKFAQPEDIIIYTITVKNLGEDIAYNVVVKDILPLGVTYIASEPEASVKGRELNWSLGEISPVSPPLHIKVLVAVSSEISQGTHLRNCAIISYTDSEGRYQPVKEACVEAEVRGKIVTSFPAY
ncbi:MAG: hypothetical protein U9O41_07930 [Candidatus Aerophobetes bacterium]|nr:hypothetical protein [Candidatus Aerophobetes bacterium]